MMSIEPGAVDTNVLVYAMDAGDPRHRASRALLDAARKRDSSLYVTAQILCEFYSVVTNPRRVSKPRSAPDAIDAIYGMLTFLEVLPSPTRMIAVLLEFLRRYPVKGAAVFDLQIAATLQANNVQRIYTFNDKDFEVFPELIAIVPRT